MSELRKANTDATYFLTFTVVGWIDVFTRSTYCDVIIDSLQYCRAHKGLDIFSYVIMPSHVHLVARQIDGRLSYTIRDLKAHIARNILQRIESGVGESRKDWLLRLFRHHAKLRVQNTIYAFWQKTNHPTQLSSEAMMHQKVNYIHNNPVQAGLVINPESWYYSSACTMNPFKTLAY